MDVRDDSAEILLQSFLQKAVVSRSGMERDVHVDVVHPAFTLLTVVLPILQGALKNGIGEAVVKRDMPEPCEFPSLDSHAANAQNTSVAFFR